MKKLGRKELTRRVKRLESEVGRTNAVIEGMKGDVAELIDDYNNRHPGEPLGTKPQGKRVSGYPEA